MKRIDIAVELAKAHPYPFDNSITKETWAYNILTLADRLLEVDKTQFSKEEALSSEEKVPYKEIVGQVIAIYNEVYGRKIECTDAREANIIGRVKEAQKHNLVLNLHSFRAVFEHKKEEWYEDEDKKSWCSLEYLTSRSNFQKYLEQARVKAKEDKSKGPTKV